MSYDAIVLGGGPAGLTAGIYLSRARMKTLVLDEGTVGGQMVLTHEVANYPGVESASGYQLATTMKKQALKFGFSPWALFGGKVRNGFIFLEMLPHISPDKQGRGVYIPLLSNDCSKKRS